MARSITVILVHGWSVYNTNTYCKLPARLKAEAQRTINLDIEFREIWLGKYVSFQDEVKLPDLARGFEAAINRELADIINEGKRFVVITHSTGGPVIRLWWHNYYQKSNKPCPMSHLIMLAPANFGSALAQLGKSRLSRIKTWFERVEPGQGVLDWLELGSPESWELNRQWITGTSDPSGLPSPVFIFTLTGQTIDRKLYDNLNTYTGELGSDGVVRVAAANLNANYVSIKQQHSPNSNLEIGIAESKASPRTAFKLIAGRSHSGEEKGIMRSIQNDNKAHPTISALLECLSVENSAQYAHLADSFDAQNENLRNDELVETATDLLLKRYFIHDRMSMLIIRVMDHIGFPVLDYDFMLLGTGNDPNKLPPDFFKDRQRNSRSKNTLTYFVNFDILKGCLAIKNPSNRRKALRPDQTGVGEFGIEISPRPQDGYVYYVTAMLAAGQDHLSTLLKPDQTTLVDIELQRRVGRGVFELTTNEGPEDFRKQPVGNPVD